MPKWQPGVSGNPKGRPKGSMVLYRKILADRAEDMLQRMLELADAGDVGALRWVCDRLVPPLKARSEPARVSIPTEASLSDQGKALLRALADGNLSASEVAELIGALQAQAKLIEVSDLLPRVESLEAERNTKP